MDINTVFMLLILFAGLSVIRAGALGRRQRSMRNEIEQLRAERAAPLPPQRGPSLDQVQMLEDRVRVLERIVTDQNYGLAREIEALRDPSDRRQAGETI